MRDLLKDFALEIEHMDVELQLSHHDVSAAAERERKSYLEIKLDEYTGIIKERIVG